MRFYAWKKSQRICRWVLFPCFFLHLAPLAVRGGELAAQMQERVLSIASKEAAITGLEVFAGEARQPLFGQVRRSTQGMEFLPASAFRRGLSYRVVVRMQDGSVREVQAQLMSAYANKPRVSLSPNVLFIPANTLRLWLDFTEPMEQGVFLQNITLRDASGAEVAGAFRETELWSPDGKRLTLMLHPGRQKTGVNLNLDEGPVLTEGRRYELVLSGKWRSIAGIELGKEVIFPLRAGPADHTQPDPAKWQLEVPAAMTLKPVKLVTDELFEPEILRRAVQVLQTAGEARTSLLPGNRVQWSFTPKEPWQAGKHEITILATLEDLAGNSVEKPFEVDVTQKPPQANKTRLEFEITPLPLPTPP